MFGVDAVDPDYGVASVYFGVERPTAGISNELTLLESEDVHEEPLGGLHVVIHPQRNDGLGFHAMISFLNLGARNSIKVPVRPGVEERVVSGPGFALSLTVVGIVGGDFLGRAHDSNGGSFTMESES